MLCRMRRPTGIPYSVLRTVFRGELQQRLRFERVADHNARVAPVAQVTVVLGWQAFEQREGAVAQRFAR